MCECGCSLNDVQFWIPAPSKGKYVITLASPCEDCETPAGVIIEHFDREKAKSIELDYVQELDLKKPAAFPIMYPHKLFKKLMRVVCKVFKVRDLLDIPDELYNKLELFDPDEAKRELFELFGATLRAGVRTQMKQAKGSKDVSQ